MFKCAIKETAFNFHCHSQPPKWNKMPSSGFVYIFHFHDSIATFLTIQLLWQNCSIFFQFSLGVKHYFQGHKKSQGKAERIGRTVPLIEELIRVQLLLKGRWKIPRSLRQRRFRCSSSTTFPTTTFIPCSGTPHSDVSCSHLVCKRQKCS